MISCSFIRFIFKPALPVLIFSFALVPRARAQGAWKFLTEKDGVKVYAQTVPESKVKALKVECVLSSGMAQLVALLLDVKAAERWVSHTRSCSLIRKISAAELYYYSEINLPWPLENRDFVV